MTRRFTRRFTRPELEAAQEALIFRMAGELGEDACPAEDYDSALDRITERLARFAPLTEAEE